MNDIQERLHALTTPVPSDLEERTLLEAGAADRIATADTPIGAAWIAWSRRGVTGLTPLFAAPTEDAFMAHHRRRSYHTDHLPRDLEAVITRGLETGDASDVPVDFAGIATFQASVLAACATIPAGAVRPYGWIADEIGNPGSVRAVGTALGRNPIPLIVPCHRVVRSDGSIGQYAFGADIKRELLIREGAILA